MWRLPGELSYKELEGNAFSCPFEEIDLASSGFLLAPFDLGNGVHYLPGIPETKEIPTSNFQDSHEPRQIDLVEDRRSYLELGHELLMQLKNDSLRKVVLSRSIDVGLELNPETLFFVLCQKYPNAFVYHVALPEANWIGATPEILLSVDGAIVKTNSLAGTRPVNSPDEWTQKELEEQRLVTDYILSALKQNGITEISEGDLITKKAGNVKHLLTEISGRLSNPETLKEVIRSIHPTPAVAGIPLQNAENWIKQNEGYDREFYTGFVGPTGADLSLFVNLRCLKQTEAGIRLYVGGGYTAQSDPKLEWTETVEKSKTLINVITALS